MKRVTVPFFISHRRCPHRCVFCDQRSISGASGEIPTAADILSRIAEYRSSAGGRRMEAAFFGGSFTLLPRETQRSLLSPLQPLLSGGTLASIRISTRPDAVGEADISFLREMGVETVELGVQSMDEAALAASGRGHTAADAAAAILRLKEAGMRVGAQLMTGLPGDSGETSLLSTRRVLELRPDFLRIYPVLVLRGTTLEEMLRRGEYRPLSPAEAVQRCKVMLREALKANVPVVRIGLQPTDTLEGEVVAGPYHPAFGQLAEGELYYDLLRELLPGFRGEVGISCHPSAVSNVVGQARRNVVRLEREFPVSLRVVPEPSVRLYELRLSAAGTAVDGDIATCGGAGSADTSSVPNHSAAADLDQPVMSEPVAVRTTIAAPLFSSGRVSARRCSTAAHS